MLSIWLRNPVQNKGPMCWTDDSERRLGSTMLTYDVDSVLLTLNHATDQNQ